MLRAVVHGRRTLRIRQRESDVRDHTLDSTGGSLSWQWGVWVHEGYERDEREAAYGDFVDTVRIQSSSETVPNEIRVHRYAIEEIVDHPSQNSTLRRVNTFVTMDGQLPIFATDRKEMPNIVFAGFCFEIFDNAEANI